MTTRNEIVAKALSKKGNFSSYVTLKTCKTLKGFDGKIEKLTRARNIMIGAAYDNRQAVIEARANGDLPSENQGLKGKEWIQYPILLKSLANGKELIRVNVLNNSKFESQWLLNGEPIEYEKIEQYLYSGEKRKPSNEPRIVFDIAVDNVIELN
jgi:hypothetical protein